MIISYYVIIIVITTIITAKNADIKPSSIDVYKHFGRGSLTTIPNFLKTWHREESVIALPALISLPDTLAAWKSIKPENKPKDKKTLGQKIKLKTENIGH